MLRFLTSLIFLLFSVALIYANGDPVVAFSSINRVANPEPLSINEIRVLTEVVNITHKDGYNCFDINYKFYNSSDKDFPEIHYGFPIDYYVVDSCEAQRFVNSYYSESEYERGWNEKMIKDISFVYNGKTLPFQSAKETVREAGYEIESYGEESDTIPVEGINRRWYYTKFSMLPRDTTTLSIEYKVYANAYSDIYIESQYNYRKLYSLEEDNFFYSPSFMSRYLPFSIDILYDFSPAKHFGGGREYPIDLNIDLSNVDSACISIDGAFYDVSRIKRYYRTRPSAIEPLKLHIFCNHSKEKIQRVVDEFTISNLTYLESRNENQIEISFRDPTFVTNLWCEIDDLKIDTFDVTFIYSDGKQITRIYHKKDDRWKSESPFMAKLLAINEIDDCYGIAGKEYDDSPSFMLEKIILDFSNGGKTPSLASNVGEIKVLNAKTDKLQISSETLH